MYENLMRNNIKMSKSLPLSVGLKRKVSFTDCCLEKPIGKTYLYWVDSKYELCHPKNLFRFGHLQLFIIHSKLYSNFAGLSE